MKRQAFLRNGVNYDVDEASADAGLVCGPGMTQQQFKEESDINTIVKRFGLTGQLPENLNVPVSGDFTGISDFHTAMNVVRQAQESFNSLPGDLRARFSNDPGRLLAFLGDEKNRDEAVRLGLVNKPPEVDRNGVPVAPAAPAAPPGSAPPAAA